MNESNMIMTEEITIKTETKVTAELPTSRALLKQAWQTFRAHWQKWLSLTLTPYLFFLAYFGAVFGAVGSSAKVTDLRSLAPWQNGLMVAGAVALLAGLVVLVVTSLALIKGAVETERSYKQLLRDGFSYFWRAVWLTILLTLLFAAVVALVFGLSLALGYVTQRLGVEQVWLVYLLMLMIGLILTIPLAILAVRLMFVMQALVLGDQKNLAAFKDSNKLTRGWWWPLVWRAYVAVLITMLVNFLSVIPYAGMTVSLLLLVVWAPIMTFYQVHLYQSLTAIKMARTDAIASWPWWRMLGALILWLVSFVAVVGGSVALSRVFYGARLIEDSAATNFDQVGLSSDEYADTDGDQLSDYLEGFFGTDPNNPDTNGDGVSDFEAALSQYIQDGDLLDDSASAEAVTP